MCASANSMPQMEAFALGVTERLVEHIFMTLGIKANVNPSGLVIFV